MNHDNINFTVTERFLRYVRIDTQSDSDSSTCPSTEKQKGLGRLLVEELLEIGISDANMDDHGYVYATVPSNTEKDVPVICFCSHIDTSPDCSGKNVKPVIHKNYSGGSIMLSKDTSQIIDPAEHPDLHNQTGNDIITTDGTTLLGADDKAGLAEIMDAVNHLVKHPWIKHGKIRILFTPDEEIGRGADKVDIKKLGADFGYTVDGEVKGSIEDETFSADGVTLTVNGKNIHPGFAKGRLENATKIASDILSALPKDSLSPETTEGREGFIHPVSVSGNAEQVVVKFIIRSFETEQLKKLEIFLKRIITDVMKNYYRSSFDFKTEEQYCNMKYMLDKYPEVVEYAVEAVKRAGIEPLKGSIRGGTDGSRLSYMGLPCPNIFAGGHAFHSKLEWVSVQDMQKAVETIVQLCMIWEEKAGACS